MTDDVRIIGGDCLDVLPTLAAGSIDAVVTDPPYAQTNEGYDSDVACRADVWRECYRVAKADAALVAFAGSPTYHRIASAIEAGGWRVRQMWAWVYRDGLITSAYPKEGFDRLAPAMDPIVYATKGKVLLDVRREGDHEWDRVTGRKDPFDRVTLSERSSGNHRRKAGAGRYPRSVVASEGVGGFQYFLCPRSSATKGEAAGHPNQKPLWLLRWLLGLLPGGTALDPFLGSGTTAIACLREGRKCVGIEIQPEYAEIARKRVASELAGTPLFVAGTNQGEVW